MFGKPRLFFGVYVVVTLAIGMVLAILAPYWLIAWGVLALLAVVGVFDLGSRHNVLQNYPIIGHMRYMLEFIRPEIRQYFFESEHDGRPFNREQRRIVNQRADRQGDTAPFGTRYTLTDTGYDFVHHSMAPATVDPAHARITIGGPQCAWPYSSSRLNISAMSFGALSGNAVAALNKAAALGGFAQDTGEGAISKYHREHGGDIIWEVASGNFGCRDSAGRFDPDAFRDKACTDQVKMVEIKLSQGAKPGHGGLLPAAKITPEIAETRAIPAGEDCQSPAMHPEVDSPNGLLHFVARLRELCGGKPVGFKLCLGHRHEFMGICKAMLETGIQPDFIAVDGAEGGTGAAPAEFEDFVGSYIHDALPFVHNCLVGIGKRREITVIASGKVAVGFDMVEKLALGADMCNAARAFMFSIGCIQSQRCHTNTCPTGVATQDPARARSLDVAGKALRARNFHDATVNAFLDLTGALGISDPGQLSPRHIYHRYDHGAAGTYALMHPDVDEGDFLDERLPQSYQRPWALARAATF
ncbi:FMN-binding glutamate synthase family protein [Salinisphaera sp. USBA-960]|nr:FMN-binding glutamate synthase family protein [Salifodinibacter halophilus]NNC26975.1 FMN-binding glutamate synthase family protein [Salifodinibacter halophilus]